MQVLLNADPHTDGRHKMAEHLETVVKEALELARTKGPPEVSPAMLEGFAAAKVLVIYA